jgi:aspartate-semialdehyde dehydrogenase
MLDLPITIVGATGLVGSTLLSLLAEHKVAPRHIHLVASQQSAGSKISYDGQDLIIHDLASFDFSKTKIAFFCVSNDLAATYAPVAAKAGNVVIDKSSYYRNNPDVPLIIPEVNPEAFADYKKMNIIASPNCNTIPIAVGLKAIYDAAGIVRMNVATYQSVSGTGKDAITELTMQSRQCLDHQAVEARVYPQQIAFNVLPHIDEFLDNGYTREEMKIVWEMKKIFNDPDIAINPTAVRVPVYYGHSAAVHIETRDKLSAADALLLLEKAQGVVVIRGDKPYPTAVKDAAGHDPVYVGRVREDLSHAKGLNFWIVADNLRKGAALNALQIAHQLVKQYI